MKMTLKTIKRIILYCSCIIALQKFVTTKASSNDGSVWIVSDEKSFMEVLNPLPPTLPTKGGILTLLATIDSSCTTCQTILPLLEQACQSIHAEFNVDTTTKCSWNYIPLPKDMHVPMPRIALMDIAPQKSHKQTPEDKPFYTHLYEESKGVPNFQFVLHSPQTDVDIILWDHMSTDWTVELLKEAVLHYWYRHVVSHAFYSFGEGSSSSSAPLYKFASWRDYKEVMYAHGDLMFSYMHPTLPHVGPEEEAYIHALLQPLDTDQVYLSFVQCRCHGDEKKDNAYDVYEELGHAFLHRMDVLFHVLDIGEESKEEDVAFCSLDKEEEGMCQDGMVKLIRYSPSSFDAEEEEWELFHERLDSSIYLPPPSTSPRPTSSSSSSQPTKHAVTTTMTQYLIKQTTPLPLYYTKDAASYYAFPHYRKIHVILFIDLHHKREETEHSRLAIQLLRDAAYEWINEEGRREDVVFLVMPSTEIRILNTFGVDIWSPLDVHFMERLDEIQEERKMHKKEAQMEDDLLSPNDRKKQQQEVVESLSDNTNEIGKAEQKNDSSFQKETPTRKNDILPLIMITDRRSPPNGGTAMMKRYYLQSSSILNSTKENNAIYTFLDQFWNNALLPSIHSQTTPSSQMNVTNDSGVKILTGHSFQHFMNDTTENADKHVLIHFYAPSCGHCKRFNIIWNELAQLITYMNWNSVMEVMKMDVTKNEVVVLNHAEEEEEDGRKSTLGDMWSLPSVFYFPAGEKRNVPIPMEAEEEEYQKEAPKDETFTASNKESVKVRKDGVGGINSAYEIIEWLVGQGKIDTEELLRLEKEGIKKKEKCLEEERRRKEEEKKRMDALGEEVLHDILEEIEAVDFNN
uniref:protein disulfide-isomerase n=1 Tax=Ditylum brightwellii TaxID=49249 RepID=A0A7S2E691_9STRA|mmetsp:Transcript_15240/g.22683  ORF Transcript_15240/g.22683 Transcript_15240/m.22683 type:complete len:855 (+) Transcript_15240:48-2612(+)